MRIMKRLSAWKALFFDSPPARSAQQRGPAGGGRKKTRPLRGGLNVVYGLLAGNRKLDLRRSEAAEREQYPIVL